MILISLKQLRSTTRKGYRVFLKTSKKRERGAKKEVTLEKDLIIILISLQTYYGCLEQSIEYGCLAW